jgi:hypothetical protein
MSPNRVAGAPRSSWPLVFSALCMLLLLGTIAFFIRSPALSGETVTLSGTQPGFAIEIKQPSRYETDEIVFGPRGSIACEFQRPRYLDVRASVFRGHSVAVRCLKPTGLSASPQWRVISIDVDGQTVLMESDVSGSIVRENKLGYAAIALCLAIATYFGFRAWQIGRF